VRVLAIETATPCVGCALWADGAPLASFSLVAGPRHAEVLMPAIDWLCRGAGLAVADIDAVAVDVGPGLFTGLRVGLATAGAMAMARGIPSVGVTSLDALAHPHRRRPGLVAAVVDARRAEVYWALYRSDGGSLEQLEAPAVAGPAQVAASLAALGQVPLAVGDGAWRYRDQFEAAGVAMAGPGDMWPSPLVLAEMGAGLLSGGGPGTHIANQPAPLYLRQADVRIGWDQVDGRVGPPGADGAAGPAPAASAGAT
jgi:tRNA threonylcarbamoyladenosine biosynthesis protein TsaB